MHPQGWKKHPEFCPLRSTDISSHTVRTSPIYKRREQIKKLLHILLLFERHFPNEQTQTVKHAG